MVLPSKSVALPLTVEPSTWKSPLDRITPMDGGTAVKKSRQPLLRSEINARVAQFTVSVPPDRLQSYITPGMTRKQYDLSRTSTKYIVPRELEYRCNTQKKSNNQKTIPPSCLKMDSGMLVRHWLDSWLPHTQAVRSSLRSRQPGRGARTDSPRGRAQRLRPPPRPKPNPTPGPNTTETRSPSQTRKAARHRPSIPASHRERGLRIYLYR